MTWTIERRRIPRLSDVEDVRVTCPKGHLEPRGAFRVLRGASVTAPLHPCERCVSIDERRAAKAAGATVPAKPKRRTAEERIADHAAKAGEHLARVAERAARRMDARKARQAREDKRARERLRIAERRVKADRVARQLVKLWEAGALPPEVLKMLEVA